MSGESGSVVLTVAGVAHVLTWVVAQRECVSHIGRARAALERVCPLLSGDTKTDPPGDTKTDPLLHT